MVPCFIQYILTAALRDRLLISFLITLIIGISLSSFLASTAVTEKDQFFLVFVASIMRLASVFTVITFVVFYVRKVFETREVEYMLTKPVTKLGYLLSHSIAFIIIAFAFVLVSSATLFLIMPAVSLSGLIFWSMSLLVELIIMVHVAIFFSFSLNSAVTASLASCAFYALSRMVGGILGVIHSDPASGIMMLLEKIMLVVSMVVPRLDLLARSEWLVYGLSQTITFTFLGVQLILFTGLIFFATLLDFNRREF